MGTLRSYSTIAILVAAGRGERMGGGPPKAFRLLGGKTLLLWSALAFEATPEVDGLVAVVPAEAVAEARDLLGPVGKLLAVVPGGPRRQDSVWEGLRAAPPGFAGLVLVHDAARPFVDDALIATVLRAAREVGAAVPVLEVVDTIKKIQGGRVAATVDRAELGAAQTPQGFRHPLLVRAYQTAMGEGAILTDEAMAVERLGAPVAAVKGSPRNRKMTTADDLRWAEDLLRAEGSR